jgi:tetratricopeptide (TPR) repeat protein
LKLVLTIAAILLIVGFAQASTLTVCPSGCGYTSIQNAVYAAHPNDTIEVHSGTYNESVVLTKDIMFNGIDTGSGEPIVNGDLYKDGFNSALRGFSFQSISSNLPYTKEMATPNTTIYWIEKAFENPSKPKAIAALDNIIKTNPKDAWAWFEKGVTLYNSGRYDESIGAFNESLKLDPYFSYPWNWKNNDFYELKKYDQALEATEKAIQLEPNHGAFWSSKGDALKALGRISESDEAYAKAKELGYGGGTTTISPNATPGTNILAVCPSGCGYTSIQTAVYAAHPNDTIEVHSGTYNESVVLTKDVTFNGIDTGSGEPIVNGDLYKNFYTSALRGLSFQSISSNLPYPQYMTTPNTTIYWIEKAFEDPSKPKAIAALDNIIKTNPKDAWAWYRKGVVLYSSGRYDESLSAYNESIKLDPYFSFPWGEKGNDFYSLKKYDNSLVAVEKAIQLEPNDGYYWSEKGDALHALGRTSESDEAYAKAEDLGYWE